MKLNRIYRYLGDDEPLLNSRQSCPAVLGPTGVPALVTAGGDLLLGLVEPRVTRLSGTRALVVYRLATGVTLYASVITLDGVTITSVGDAQVISTGGSTSYGGEGVVYLSDNKVLCGYIRTGATLAARVLNISGDTVTPATLTDVSTTASVGAYTTPVRLELIAAGVVLASFKNTNNGRLTAQVWSVDGSDNVTFGTEVRNDVAGNNFSHIQSAVISPTKAVMIGQTGTRLVAVVVTITGTVVAFAAINYTFATGTQVSGSFSIDHPSIAKVSTTQVVVTALLTTLTPAATNSVSIFKADIDGSDVITSTTITQETTELGTVPRMIMVGLFPTTVYRKPGVSPAQTLRLLQHSLTLDPPSSGIKADLLVAPAGVAFPEHAVVLSPLVLAAYEHTDTSIGLVAYSLTPSVSATSNAIGIAAAGVGYFTGGYEFLDNNWVDSVERISFFNGVVSLVSGYTVSTASGHRAGYGNGTRGYLSGAGTLGGAVDFLTTTEKMVYSTEILSVVGGAALNTGRTSPSGVGDADKGFVVGGDTSAGPYTATAERNTYSTETLALVPGADMTYAKIHIGAAGNATVGFLLGGLSDVATAAQTREADKLTYSTETTAAAPTADMLVGTSARRQSGGGSLENGYFVQSRGNAADLEVLTYATDTLALGALLPGFVNHIPGIVGNLDSGFIGTDPIPSRIDYATGVAYLATSTVIPVRWYAASISPGIFS